MLFVNASAMSAAQNHHLKVCSSQTARTGMSSKKRMDVLVIGSSRSGTIIPHGGAKCNRRQKYARKRMLARTFFRGRSCRRSLNYLRGFLMFACGAITVPSAVAKLGKIPPFSGKIPHLKHYHFLTLIHQFARNNKSSLCPS